MTILVTGASGHLGHLVVERLLARGAAASDIVAGARTPAKIADLADLGVRVVELDYDRPDTITAALEGVDRVLLVSGSEVGKRAAQHQAVIDAASGVEQFVYTSLYHATESTLPLAGEHIETEKAIAASGLPAVLLRNNWYTENYAADVARSAESGELVASVGDGRISSASRVDFADAAAVVLLGEGHVGQTYELAGDVAWTFDELAAAASEVTGREVAYRRLNTEAHAALLESFGLDAGTVGFVTALDAGIAQGGLEATERTLSELIGRPTTPLVEGLRSSL
ncbi:SDR family oxidoreductase [Microbacterium sp. cx-55]|uniref:SDR family oxidoreductase n=1 Tax=unclassified Microbacterium TaxID=2609290 RepID=UPI001CBDA3FF|nr:MULTISPECIES: SDR family oxidoreductase [unclassified Microbacterium]MBZ4487235.1 SDR family oxidoreductase [Microbacterium sp. cx-55]MCC4908647.1 SDR family oxidoreductase [Microbacterium sp. cx-59]UGB35259.1 SDR family oxidoreductase [Microbacterium sp. cx-55]